MTISYEEQYFELLEECDRAEDNYAKTLSVEDCDKLLHARRKFQFFCTIAFEKILEKNSNVWDDLK